MYREVKFRVWDKDNKCMDEVDGIDLYIANNKIYEVCERSWAYSQFMDKTNVTDRYELMEYTSLKAEGGIEGYEGDIIQEGKSTGVIGFTEGQFYIDWKINKDFWSDSLRYHLASSKIIGNIYENPELLEGG